MTALPYSVFSTDALPVRDRFAAWREDISGVFEVDRVPQLDSEPFHADFRIYNFGRSILAELESSPGRYTRSKRKRARDGFDAILLQLFVEGGVEFGVGSKTSQFEAGDIVVFDLSQSVDNINSRFHHLTSMWPRPPIEAVVPRIADWHGKALPRDYPTTALLRQHILSSYKLGLEFTPAEGRRVEEATLSLASACMTGRLLDDELEPAPEMREVLIYQIKRHIRTNLTAVDQTPEQIAQHFGISRRRLYQLLEPIGGIASFQRKLRLQHCFDALQDPAKAHLKIASIAHDAGFAHAASFNRGFRAMFGMAPKEARERLRDHPVGVPPVSGTKSSSPQVEHRQWFQTIGT